MWEQQSLFDRMKEVLKIPLEMDFDSYADADIDVVTNAMLSDVEIVDSILQAKDEEETDQVDEEVDPIVHIPHPKERFKNKNVAFGAVEKDTERKNGGKSKQLVAKRSWIKLYDFENNSLKEDEKIKNLMYYLTDSALEWYADEIISNPAIKRWEVVKEKLIQRFGSYSANPIVSASHRRLKREESIENYFQDKIRLLNQTHLTKEEKIHLLTDGLPNDWKDLIVAAQPTDATKLFHIAASIEQNRASIQFKPKNKIHLATKNNDNRKNVCPFWCPICSKKGIKIKHWVTDCEDYDPNYKKDRPNQNTSVKQVCGAPELLNVSTLTNTPTQGAFKLINMSVEVNGIPAQAFVDTGATVSIINWRLFKRTRLQLQPNSDIHISQADGVTRTCGSLQTKVRIDKLIKPVTLHVMKNFKYPLLIGLDVASLFNLLIDVKDKTIYTKFDGLQNPILVNHLEEIREHELKKLLEHNRNVFCQHAIDLGKVAMEHKIITKSEQPISLRPYRRPLKEYEEIAEQVKELLEHKLIRISDSPWAFPVVMVPKKDGNKRMCIDYRRLNEITLDDRQPLPHIQDMFDRLHGSRLFSTLDVAWGYWQIEMDPQSIQKTAFVTNDGHYEFLVMPFGLKNAASTFQRIIQHILGELLWKGTCSFQDDILVYTKPWQEHIELLSKVFDKLRRKVKSIQDFPRPDTVKKVRQFMGLANYYRKFVKDFSKISFPLVRLTRKNQPFIWNEEVEESFAKLKMALSTKPVLAIYNPDYPSKVYTDASKYGIGAILTQIGPDNEEHVIAYYSKTLQPHQENYSAYEMECLAVIQATDHFHVYIENQPFEIITDHAALQWLFTMKKPKPKYFRWILSLSSKSCNIVHRSGKQQTHVDALSRLPVVNIATQELQEHQQNSDLSFLKNSHTHDGVVMIKQKGVFKAVVPNSLTKKILEEYHDSLSHPSITKTCKLITQCYWWKGITTDIKNYVRSCQLVKVRHEPTLGEMITPTSNIQPLQMIGCDTIVLGTAAANTKHKFIQVFVDHATRYLWAYPTITNTAQAVTQCLDKIIKSVNSINTILTDNGKNFISKEFNKFLSLQGIKHTYTSPYHPQCNGICEKLNDTIMTKLRIAVLEKPRCKWSTLLPQVAKNYNSTPHDVTGFSPLFLMYGIGNVPEFADQTPITIEEARKKASLRTEQIRSRWKIKHDSHHPKYVFKEGDLVIRKIAFNDPRLIKTSPKYEGPFVIQKNISDVTYDISLKDQKQARRKKMEAQTYELIVKKIRQHLEPKKKIIPQRCLFLKRTQRENESVSEYLRELKHLASNCSFGEMLEMMLRDRFVAGLTSESLQKRLLQEDDEVKLERVFALAVSYELAEKDAKELHEKEVARVTSHIERIRKSKYSPTKENFASATKERTCYRCGMKNSHLAPACPQKFKTCYKCRKIGHLSNVCKAKGNAQKSGYVQQQNIFSLKSGTEVKIALTVDGQILNGIVDTGSPVTLMPKSIFEKLWRAKPLIPTAINLKSFCNNPIKVVGERKVFVKEANMSLRLIVVDESIPEILLGREWLKFLNINYSKLLNVNKISESCIDSLIGSYANLFKDELGCLKYVKLDINIKKEEAPVFCKARSLPYSLKKKVEDELECMVERGILEPIVHASWAAPIVPVVKKDGSIRICGDFRSTANKAIILDKYPLPTIDEIFSRLSGSTIFSTLDLSMAYLQVELTDEAKRVVNINTTKGLFAYRRLPYGVAVAPNKFQRLMDNVFADIPGVACYIDDILVSGKDAKDHKSKLELVFKILEEKGLKLNKAKCKFAVDSVEYLGFRIDKDGLHPMLNKIQAVSNAPEPKNIGQLRSFIGMLMYYARFIKDTSSILSPLYQLLKKNCPWKWTNKHRVLFNKCKSLLTDDSVLAHYDPAKELVLACDASSYGLGVLEKEALSIVYGCEKFRQYLLGRSFVLVTDNRPLMHLFSPHKPIPLCAASRIKRWSLKLGAFHYSVEFRKTEDHGNADALSRLPLKANEGGSYDDDQILLLRKMNEVPFSFQDVAFETKRDNTLAIVLRNVREDTWQSPKFTKENPLSPYYKVRNELSVDFGCLQWKKRIVIPPKLRSQILIDLHEMHFGMVKMMIIARRYFWWPGIDRSIEDMARQCTICQETADMPSSMITEWTWPEKPWHRLHLDLAGPFMGKMFLVIVDAYTKWLEIFILRDITSKTIVDCLRQVFARFGLPEFLVTDNGRQFVSREMEEFTRMNRIRHTKTSPYNPSTNGLAERYVREFKTSLKKNNEKDDLETNLQRFLFAHRAFPQSVLKESPAELLMNRRLKSRFSNLMPKMDMKGEGFPDALRKQEHFKIGSDVFFRNYAAGP
ncbi:K02A2.6-like, partial [Cordylochernes scorpioides]